MRAPLSGGFVSFPLGLGTYVVLVALVLVFTPLDLWRTQRHAWRLRHDRR